MIPKIGEHVLIAGQNGSGKTASACCILLRCPGGSPVIYDTKDEPKFAALPGAEVFDDFAKLLETAKQDISPDFLVFRPDTEIANDPHALDEFMLEHYKKLRGHPAYVDEAYTMHVNGKEGQGLRAILTRGRSKGISCILSTQRPAWISRFTITEAKHHIIHRLTHKDDKRRVGEFIPGFEDFANPVKFGFWYYSTETGIPKLYAPWSLDKSLDMGQTDVQDTIDASVAGVQAVASKTVKWF